MGEPVAKHLPARHGYGFIFMKFMHRKDKYILFDVDEESPRRGGVRLVGLSRIVVTLHGCKHTYALYYV